MVDFAVETVVASVQVEALAGLVLAVPGLAAFVVVFVVLEA